MDISSVFIAISALLGAGLGFALARSVDRKLAEESLEKGRAEAAAEIAVLRERVVRMDRLDQLLSEAGRIEDALREQISQGKEAVGRREAELAAEKELANSLREDLQKGKAEHERLVARLSQSESDIASLSERLAGQQQRNIEQLALLQEAKAGLSDHFKSLAQDILQEKSKTFAEQQAAQLGQVLDPLKSKLQEFKGKVEEVYLQEGKDRSALAEQVRQLLTLNQALSEDAKNLTSALKGSSKTQGSWGELVLEHVLEASGLRKGEEYDVQESALREDGSRAQPDVIVHLPEGRQLIIDSKVSLNAYESYVNAEDDQQRLASLKQHLDSVRAHMKGLAEKNYQNLFPAHSLDFVLMFVPIEPAFMVAVTQDKDLFMEAWRRNVLLVSPSTLLFVVRTVAHLWRQEAQNRNAQEIAQRGAELYDRLAAFVGDVEKIGERLKQAQDSFNDARDKLCRNRGNVIRQAEMLKQLGVKPSKSLPPGMVDSAADGEGQ